MNLFEAHCQTECFDGLIEKYARLGATVVITNVELTTRSISFKNVSPKSEAGEFTPLRSPQRLRIFFNAVVQDLCESAIFTDQMLDIALELPEHTYPINGTLLFTTLRLGGLKEDLSRVCPPEYLLCMDNYMLGYEFTTALKSSSQREVASTSTVVMADLTPHKRKLILDILGEA